MWQNFFLSIYPVIWPNPTKFYPMGHPFVLKYLAAPIWLWSLMRWCPISKANSVMVAPDQTIRGFCRQGNLEININDFVFIYTHQNSEICISWWKQSPFYTLFLETRREDSLQVLQTGDVHIDDVMIMMKICEWISRINWQ